MEDFYLSDKKRSPTKLNPLKDTWIKSEMTPDLNDDVLETWTRVEITLRVFAFENGEENLKTSKWLKSLKTDWNQFATRACIL